MNTINPTDFLIYWQGRLGLTDEEFEMPYDDELAAALRKLKVRGVMMETHITRPQSLDLKEMSGQHLDDVWVVGNPNWKKDLRDTIVKLGNNTDDTTEEYQRKANIVDIHDQTYQPPKFPISEHLRDNTE